MSQYQLSEYPMEMAYPYGAPQFPQQLQVPQPAGGMMPVSPLYGGMPMFQQANVPTQATTGMVSTELSYIENIIRFNRGKMANFYMTFEYNPEWPAKVFRGRIEEAGRDHIILSNPERGKHFLLLMVNLDYVEFDEPIAYIPPLGPSAPVQQR